MKNRFEYQTECLPTRIEAEAINAMLAKRGNEGWELVAVVQHAELRFTEENFGWPTVNQYFFKRQLP